MQLKHSGPAGRRGRGLGPLVVAVILLVSGAATPSAFASGSVDQSKRKVEDLAAQLNAMETQLEQLDQDHAAALDRMDVLDAQISVQEQQIHSQQTVIGALQTQLTTIALDRFTSGGGGSASPMLSTAASFGDELERGALSQVALDQGAGTTDDLEQGLSDLQHAQDALQQTKAEQADLAASLATRLQQGTALQAKIRDEQAVAQQQYGDAVAAEQERQAQAAAAAAAAKVAAAQRANDASARAAAVQLADAPAARGGGAQGTTSSTPASSSNGSSSSNSPSPNTPSSNTSASSGSSGSSGGGTSDAGSSSNSGSNATATTDPPAPSDNSTSDAESPLNDAPSTTDTPATTEPPVASGPSSRAEIAVAAARSQLGVDYVFAAESPGVAFDCSGLTKYAWAQAGVSIPHQSGQQYASLPHVALSDLQPGDLLFYGSPIHHVAIYIGNGQMIDAPAPGKVVRIANANYANIVGAARPG